MRIQNYQVAGIFKEYPPVFRTKLEAVRRLILEVVQDYPEIGEIEETLKWGEPSYLPKSKNVGTTVRIHWLKSKPDQYGVYFNCQTKLIPMFKRKYPGLFRYEGKRAIIFSKSEKVPAKELQDCIYMALTYHRNKRS